MILMPSQGKYRHLCLAFSVIISNLHIIFLRINGIIMNISQKISAFYNPPQYSTIIAEKLCYNAEKRERRAEYVGL